MYNDVMGAPWEPGSLAWCWQQQQQINFTRIQNAIMQQQVLNFYRQQAQNVTNWINSHPFDPYPGQVLTKDGFIVNYELISSQREKGQCSNCNGEGFLKENYYMGNNHVKTNKRRCGMCHGTGKSEH